MLLILGGGVASLLFGWFDRTKDPDWAAGLFQRLHIVSISIWIVTLGLFTARAERRHP